jgi:DNA-binding transcriptional MerR regulator
MVKYNICEFAQLVGVSDRTLRRWDNSGMFRAYRTPSGRPYYTDKHYVQCTQSDFRLKKNENHKKTDTTLRKTISPKAC